MKLSRLLLTTTTALGLSMTAAVADDNESHVDQVGNDNTALIQQTGTDNRAGKAGDADSIRQKGDNNEIDLTQSGSESNVAHRRDRTGNDGLAAFEQVGDYNKADVSQSGTKQNIISIKQTSDDAETMVKNTLTATMSGNDNTLRITTQETSGTDESGNTATIIMSGDDDTINRVQQLSNLVGDGDGDVNVISATISGSETNNGFPGLRGSAAGAVRDGGLGRLLQAGEGNEIGLTVAGVRNAFSIEQSGRDNMANTISVAGDRNSLGIDQFGDDNTVMPISIAVGSDDNKIGIQQVGNFNTASASVDGDDNDFGISQEGASNFADVSITGDMNGVPGVGFSGDAGGVLTGTTGMVSGLFQQMGDENSVIVDVTGDSNSFATLQDNETLGAGVGNTINGTIDGSSNQVAIAQIGASNSTSFTQIGSGNNLGVSQ